MAVKFGMTVAQIFNQLVKGYQKIKRTEPKGLDLIKIKQEAMQRFKDMNKVVDMGGRPIDTSKGIMGGVQVGQKGIFDNIFNRMQSQMGKNIKEVKNKKPDPEKKAMGGRIGLKEGEGIMQMASVDDPFYRGGEEDEHSFRMFNKPYKDLTPDELEEFREEMMRLMNKFSSAPSLEDSRNEMMENIARDNFGKPLKDLSEDEIIQIEEMMDNMSSMPDREAPSITLADGGRAAFKEGKIANFFKSLKPFSSKNKFSNQLEGIIYGEMGLAEGLNLLSQSGLFADGGRIGYKDGPKDPRRRTFMKIAGGIASMLPFGIGKGVKMAAPVVAKAAEISGPALAKLVETVMSAGKLLSVTGRRVKEMVTKKKLGKVEVEEDIADGSYIIKKDGKEIYYKPGRMDETGGVDDDIIEVIEKRVKKAGGGIGYMLGE
tara:strand:+ start:94 stop:1383 length:1290 start_codon:yes stop_codon:yes gene_type:complete